MLLRERFSFWRAILARPQIALAGLPVITFLSGYMKKFQPRNIGGRWIIHSHLPPLDSRAHSRFIREHLLNRISGPSHAQIGLTNACPQNCEYCYNKNKTGKPMDTSTIMRTVSELKAMGVFWLGLTGGEPLLNRDIVAIIESAAEDCAVKLFTTGCGLTRELAFNLKRAGLFSVSVSLDHWTESEHDRVRRYPGAFRTALNAVETFRSVGGVHVGVSAVLSKKMIRDNEVEPFLRFLDGLGIDEAWVSEAKPSVPALWDRNSVIDEDERLTLMRLQDHWNRKKGMTVNYLGHFEGQEHFGCCAGHKMVYVDSFGNVSPCVFAPLTFGNVADEPLPVIFRRMRKWFPSENRCFTNANFELFKKHYRGVSPLAEAETLNLMDEVSFAPLARFFELQYGRRKHP